MSPLISLLQQREHVDSRIQRTVEDLRPQKRCLYRPFCVVGPRPACAPQSAPEVVIIEDSQQCVALEGASCRTHQCTCLKGSRFPHCNGTQKAAVRPITPAAALHPLMGNHRKQAGRRCSRLIYDNQWPLPGDKTSQRHWERQVRTTKCARY